MLNEKNRKREPNHRFIKFWAMGMNDYEIAKQIGVKVDTLRTVKKDLCNPDNQ
ncbi:hypothetical protein [Anoxybacter fermentans]|uniref:hypothetical protein n=1 Tax=Anoxybacter fermentans TaxID=1323375 RepID=UPI0013DF7D2D|nr:hypothetical protein [Anoxybacter fermentans]